MFFIILLVHVISALFLGSYLSLPFVINSVFSRTGDELKSMLKMIVSFTGYGHYALMFILITGVWMVVQFSAYPSFLWVGTAILLLIIIGGLIGTMHIKIKNIIEAENAEESLLENGSKIKLFSWLIFIFIVISVFIMTNRNLF